MGRAARVPAEVPGPLTGRDSKFQEGRHSARTGRTSPSFLGAARSREGEQLADLHKKRKEIPGGMRSHSRRREFLSAKVLAARSLCPVERRRDYGRGQQRLY